MYISNLSYLQQIIDTENTGMLYLKIEGYEEIRINPKHLKMTVDGHVIRLCDVRNKEIIFFNDTDLVNVKYYEYGCGFCDNCDNCEKYPIYKKYDYTYVGFPGEIEFRDSEYKKRIPSYHIAELLNKQYTKIGNLEKEKQNLKQDNKNYKQEYNNLSRKYHLLIEFCEKMHLNWQNYLEVMLNE